MPFWGRVGVDSNAPRTLEEHLTGAGGDGGRVDFLGKVRGGVRSREGGRAPVVLGPQARPQPRSPPRPQPSICMITFVNRGLQRRFLETIYDAKSHQAGFTWLEELAG